MAEMALEAFFGDFQNSIRAAAAADETFTEGVFVDELSKRLSAAEEVDSLIPAHFVGLSTKGRKLRLDGYDFGDEEGHVVLAIADFDPGDLVSSLGLPDARKLFSAVEGFVEASFDGSLVQDLEESSEAYQVAYELAARKPGIHKIRLYLLTNRKLGDKVKSFETIEIDGISVDYHLWDIERLRRVETSQLGREEIDIDLTEWAPEGVAALEIRSDASELTTYLAVLPGHLLAGVYRKYGGRVLEANVRSFLSARGNVNKGIRGTVLQQPSYFLAYNNGISATATSIQVTDVGGTKYVRGITDLQIVNGGQTTASLFYTEKNDKADLSQIFVQMKLIVVAPDRAAELVPKISRYANTQNKVSEADFFSNHPFHVRMEEKSRRLLVPAKAGSSFQTKWFYERTRGQFLNERAKISVAQARRFEAEYPRSQMITKTDAAKYLVSWDGRPHLVSAGAQKNFLAFANSISSDWEKDNLQFGDDYFKELVAKGILFSSLRSRIAKADWYSAGYLANITTYSMAKLGAISASSAAGGAFDLGKVWREQLVAESLLDELEMIAKHVTGVLTSDDRPVVNVTEWAKREACWKEVSALKVHTGAGIAEYLVDPGGAFDNRIAAKKLQKVDSGIAAQMRVNELGSRYWVKLRDFGKDMKSLADKDLDIIRYATGEAGRLPSEAQATYLLQLGARMEEIGFIGS